MPERHPLDRLSMLKTSLLIAFTLAVAIGGGAASVWFALQAREGVGAVTVGNWTAYPDSGTPDSDPYSRARIAREGILALGRAEGLAFVAQRDSNGDALRRDCRYTIEGTVPPARFWTLYAADEVNAAIATGTRRANALNSFQVLHQPDSSLAISVSGRPSPGNWLRVTGTGPMTFVLTLYDTPIASSTGVSDVELPQVLKAGCDA